MERQVTSFSRSLSRALSSSRTSTTTARSFSSNVGPTSQARPAPLPCQRNPSASHRCLYAISSRSYVSAPPKSRYRGPKSSEDTQTDFSAMDVLRNIAAPATSIDACTPDGFALNNMARVSDCGVLLVGGEAFRWRPWLRGGRTEIDGEESAEMSGRLKNKKGQFDVEEEVWGVLELIFPKPDLLIIGTGPHITPLSPSVREYLINQGIRVDVQDTRNAASQFNLLATERGVSQVAAALIPIGWREGS